MSAAKRKGSGAERAVVEYLRAHGFPHAERRLAGALKDRGDIAGVPAVVVEVKNCERTALGAWVDEAVLEQANDGADYGVVWHKRRGRGSAGDWYVTLPAAQLVRLLRQAGYGEPLYATEAASDGVGVVVSASNGSNGSQAVSAPSDADVPTTTNGVP